MPARPLPLLLLAFAAPVAAADSPEATRVELDRIVVTATRTPRAADDVPATVDVIDREAMDAHVVRDLKDLFRYAPGISVGSAFGRFGIGDIRIRGLGGNRVRIQTDGIAVPDAFAIGSFSNANRNAVDLDTLKRVEVVRGPSSSLYGSDALGGIVSFTTKDPSDYLTGDNAYVGVNLGFESDWNGLFAGATTAFGGERMSGLVSVSHRQGQETENTARVGGFGAARTLPNLQERDGRSLLTKWVYAPSAMQRFKLTVEGNEDATDTDVLTARGPQPLTGATNTRVSGHDQQTRARVSIAHEVDAIDTAIIDSLDWQFYRQDSETTQDTVEERMLPPPTRQDRRERRFNFDQRVIGLQANARKAFDTGRATHALAYGLDAARTDTRETRDGRRIFPLTGVVTNVVSPDTFPVRDFPISRTTTIAGYVQDEIAFANGRVRVVPAVRVDRYTLTPRVDPIFAGDNPGVAVTRITRTSVSPKLGAVWHMTPRWSLSGGYARGFRAPPYNDANIGFTNLQFGYTAIANPDLKSETSDGLEGGLRYTGAATQAHLTAYRTRYRDFIQSQRFVGVDARGLMVFQSRNVDRAMIEGAELKATLDLGALTDRAVGWTLQGAAAWSQGEDATTRAPLDVDPPSATLGIAYARGTWGAELAGRGVARRPRVSDPAMYRAPGFGVLDAYARWMFAPGARLDVGVANLLDRRYIDIGDLPLTATGAATRDRYTAPGRALSMRVAVAW